MKFVKEDNGSKKDIIVLALLAIVFGIALFFLVNNNSEKKVLDKENQIENEKKNMIIDGDEGTKQIVSEDVEKTLKCANATCKVDCEDGLCECIYNNPENKTEEIIYCEWNF